MWLRGLENEGCDVVMGGCRRNETSPKSQVLSPSQRMDAHPRNQKRKKIMGNTPGKAGTGKFCGFLGLADERKKLENFGLRVVIETKSV